MVNEEKSTAGDTASGTDAMSKRSAAGGAADPALAAVGRHAGLRKKSNEMIIASPPSRTFCGAFPSSSPLGGWKKMKMKEP